MNYYQPYQRPTGEWFYTMRNDDMLYRVGYCVQCSGHATEDEACEHYRQYCLDRARFYGPAEIQPDQNARTRTEQRCAVCDAWTMYFAQYGIGQLDHTPLCEQHLNRDSLEQVAPKVGISISSY